MSKDEKLDDIRKIISSLLVARKGATPLPVLERDYYEEESVRIPYRQFGYTDLLGFLESMPNHFIIEQYNGMYYVRGIAEKSKHVGLLVARQKTQPKSKYIPPHLRQPFNRRIQHMKSQQIKIAPDKLLYLMHYVKNNPHGVSLQNAVVIIQQVVPYVNITAQELRAQLSELPHLLHLDGNMIYPNNVAHQQPLIEESQRIEPQRNELQSDSGLLAIAQTECAGGQEDFDIQYFSDDDDFLPANRVDNYQRHEETSEQFAASHAQYANREQPEMFNKVKNNGTEIGEDFATNSNSNMEMTADYHDLSQIVSDRIKSRLKELMRKNPEGIWCADLPSAYFHEYKVHLNYTQLGFASVREFTSYLPKIFYMKQINKTDDFMLFSADKRPIVPKSDPIDITQTSHNQYGEHSTAQCSKDNDDDDNAPIPSDVSPTITKSFAPNDVMNYNDNVEKISVTELQRNNEYLAVYVVEVFHPNFFWIHLRENKRRFNTMMNELFDFYECNRNTYTIAKIALKKDMNCACIYTGRWHRGIIKSVKPDFRVTVFFYDYGTLKTYAPEDVYYLHKKFSSLPAQAIPCGLYNVIPSIGDRWKKSVNDQFIDKIADTLLAATIISIDSTYNSMMVILTDTSEEEDVVINKWLVNERLAQFGKTVRMFDIIHNLRFTIESSTRIESSIKTFHTESAININIPRHRNQSILYDDRTHRLSDVKSKDKENKTVKSLHNVPTSKKATIQMLQMLQCKSPDAKSSHVKSPPAKSLNVKYPDTESLDTKALDTKSQQKYAQNRESKTLRKLVPSLEKLKTLNQSNSDPSTSISETNTDNEDNARQIDSNKKIKSQNNSEHYNCYDYMNFSLRNSDDESDTKDFGTFRSLYGGHGLMEPFDWSVITKENNCSHEVTATVPNNLDMSIGKHENVEEKSGSYNKKNEILGKQYFLNMTRMETENFLPENNIDYDKNMFDFIETLRDKTTPNHIIKVMVAPNNKFKTLDSIQSEDTSNETVKLNDIPSSREMDQKMENRDCNIVSESVFSNISNNKNNINKEMSECNTNNSLKSNTNKVYHPMYKMLLDKMMRLDLNSNFVNSSESSSSEQILSSSYSCNTSDDIITSSNDEQSNCVDTNSRIKIHDSVKELESTSVQLPKNQTLDESHNDSKGTVFSSVETDSIASSNVDDIKQLSQSLKVDSLTCNVNTEQHQLNHSLDSDSITSSYNDDSNCQLNAADHTITISKLMQQMLKIMRNMGRSSTELDSDDLSSSRESVKDDENDESDKSNGDNKLIKSDRVSETFQSMNDNAKVIEVASVPVYNDCDVESDESEWDGGYAGSKDFPFDIAQPPK